MYLAFLSLRSSQKGTIRNKSGHCNFCAPSVSTVIVLGMLGGMFLSISFLICGSFINDFA